MICNGLFVTVVLALCGARQQPGAVPVVVRAGNGDVSDEQVAAVRGRVAAGLARLRPAFPSWQPRPFEVVVHSTAGTIPRGVREHFHDGTAGLAMLGQQRIFIVLDAVSSLPPHDLGVVVTHELVHILLHQSAGPFVPRWVHEGLAQELSGAVYLGGSEEEIVFRAKTDRLLRFRDLEADFPENALRAAYAQSFSFVAYLVRAVGLPAVLAAAAECSATVRFPQAFRSATERELLYLEKDWVDYLTHRSGAAFRVLLGSCFSLVLVAALPLLALAGVRRWNRDHETERRLRTEDEDDAEDDQPPRDFT